MSFHEVSPTPTPSWQHLSAASYTRFLHKCLGASDGVRKALKIQARFRQTYPDLRAWFSAPLAERVGRIYECSSWVILNDDSYLARPYLVFLVLQGAICLDWDWLLAVSTLKIWGRLQQAGVDLDLPLLTAEAAQLGYQRRFAFETLRWVLSRLFLHTGATHIAQITEQDVAEFSKEVQQFKTRSDLLQFYQSKEQYDMLAKRYQGGLYLLQVLLYHRGQARSEPRKRLPYGGKDTVMQPFKPRLQATVFRYLAERQITDRPATLQHFKVGLRRFMQWLAQAAPDLESFAEVTREQVLDYAAFLETEISSQTGKPLTAWTKRNYLAAVKLFFQQGAEWQWEDMPDHALLLDSDRPKMPLNVPRYIPNDELAPLMEAIRKLPCPYQRAALLIARWSGARRDEIARLPLSCLDFYPDGTPRLHIPAGKMKRERMVPLNEEAAHAIQEVQAIRQGERDRGFQDTQTGVLTRYLFVRRGKRLSYDYLFSHALEEACQAAGLMTPDSHPTVTAHRFRHTVGTQLAERGARTRTIMAILGHSTASMSMIYAHISDKEVLHDYQAVLGPGASIAGPYAESLREGRLSQQDLDWLQTNFFKTELELGHCLRLPQEGPCECDLYLSCAKFVTTPEYAPRLRRRRKRELELIEDAQNRGWQREVERHQCTIKRIEQLLADLHEPLDGPEATE
jgi:integrase